MPRTTTALSPATAGGDSMDEWSFGGSTPKRPIVHLGSTGNADTFCDPIPTIPAADTPGLPVRPVPSSQLIVGHITLAAGAQQLSAAPCQKVMLRVPSSDNGVVWLGQDNTVGPSTGYPLYPGDQLELPIANTNLVWVAPDAGIVGAMTLTYVVT